MAEARIPENFGDTQIRVRVLDFMGLGLRMPREAWRLSSPQTLHDAEWAVPHPPLMFSENCVHQRRRRDCRDGLHAQHKT